MEIQDDIGTNTTEWTPGEAAEQKRLPRGAVLGRYVIIEPIGAGGMGTIYRAYDPELNRGVALKILSVKQEDQQAAQRAKNRLIREAQALAKLSHPNVVGVHDVGSFDDDVFIAMELVEGKTLREWLAEHQTPKGIANRVKNNKQPKVAATREEKPIKRILELMSAAGRGLAAAHKAGLVHRDFKPGNVIVGDDGRVRVLDFGLARTVDQDGESEESVSVSESIAQAASSQSDDSDKSLDRTELSSSSTPNLLLSPLTNVGGILGTPLYMAPEQHLGHRTDERTDQFGFCLVLYEALYQKRAFAASTLEELKKKVVREQLSPPPPNTQVPAWLWKIIRKGLRAKPQDRYPSLALLLEDLHKDPEELRRQQRQGRNRRLLIFVLVMLTTVIPFGVWYGLRYSTVARCKATAAAWQGVWDNQSKKLIRRSFLGTNKAFALATWDRVNRLIESYVADWKHMRSDVCEARLLDATLSEELFDLRMNCLRERQRDLRALTKIFATSDAKVLRKAVQASSSLSRIAICADVKALRAPYPPPKTAEQKVQVATIRDKLAEVEAFTNTAKYKEGLDLTKKLEIQADQVGYRPIQAEVLFWLGSLLERTGLYNKAETTLHRAALAASESKNGLLAAKALVTLVHVVGIRQARHEVGLVLGQNAEVVLGLGHQDNKTRAQLRNNVAGVLHGQRRFDEALLQLQSALSIRKLALGSQHPEVARALNNMGALSEAIGEYDKALQYHFAALVLKKKTLGPQHPSVAASLTNIGVVFRYKGDYQKSLEYSQKSQKIWEIAVGPNSPDVTWPLHNIASAYFALGQFDKALSYHQKALSIREKTLGPDHPMAAESLCGIGFVLLAKGCHKKPSRTSNERCVFVPTKPAIYTHRDVGSLALRKPW